jgi:hypothetical protein
MAIGLSFWSLFVACGRKLEELSFKRMMDVIATYEDKERFNSKDNTITAPISIPSDC